MSSPPSSSPGYFPPTLVSLVFRTMGWMDLSTRVLLPSFVRWILDGIPGWELTAAGVLMNAGRGGGIIGQRECLR